MTDPQQRELNYSGVVNPSQGEPMGPGLDGRIWAVVGAMYDTSTDKTTVSLIEIPPGAVIEGLRT